MLDPEFSVSPTHIVFTLTDAGFGHKEIGASPPEGKMATLYPEQDGWSERTDSPMRRASRSFPSAGDEGPAFVTLTDGECTAILDRNHIGRIAYSFHDHVDIAPMHYVRKGAWLYGRTSPGAKLTTIAHKPWVAFEVDELERLFEWRSVVVHGGFYQLLPGGTTYDVNAWEEGVEALRQLLPASFTSSDPVPFRSVMFRISIDRITGRAARQNRCGGF
jgi:nitroimidazol reductase NimA-like FMN-containing flavoprotein (pyridoxamine 5'-phosphate oxidase superfamily)